MQLEVKLITKLNEWSRRNIYRSNFERVRKSWIIFISLQKCSTIRIAWKVKQQRENKIHIEKSAHCTETIQCEIKRFSPSSNWELFGLLFSFATKRFLCAVFYWSLAINWMKKRFYSVLFSRFLFLLFSPFRKRENERKKKNGKSIDWVNHQWITLPCRLWHRLIHTHTHTHIAPANVVYFYWHSVFGQ